MEQKQMTYHVRYEPPKGFSQIDFGELARYKDLIWLFVKRDFTVMYKQTVLGPAWILISPLMTTLMYTVMFGNIASLPTNGVPQLAFYMAGTALWTFFSTCVNKVSGTFTANSGIFSKVYFPRLTMPISTMLSAAINFVVQFVLLLGIMAVYLVCGEVAPRWELWILLPAVWLQVGLLGLGCGVIVSSLTTRYRDLAVVVTFEVQLWMYATPVVYPMSMITNGSLRLALWLNPMTAPMESFRQILFGSGQVSVLGWCIAIAETLALLWLGASLFSKVEKTFVDTV